jgi:hypothetical protein
VKRREKEETEKDSERPRRKGAKNWTLYFP